MSKSGSGKAGFFVALVWDSENPAEGDALLVLHPTYETFAEVFSRKAKAEKAAKAECEFQNGQMLHPEDKRWRWKVIELKGGKK